MIRNYRVRGHIIAKLDPLGQAAAAPPPELQAAYYGLDETREDLLFLAPWLPAGESVPLREILARLKDTYCRSIGAQFMHIDDWRSAEWLQDRMESTGNRLALSREEQLRILTRLTDAVIFEEFIQTQVSGRQELFAGGLRKPDAAAGPGD